MTDDQLDLLNPGQFLVVRTTGLMAILIRLGTRSPVNHAAIYLGEGRFLEARSRGAQISDLASVMHGAKEPYLMVVSQFNFTDEQRARVVAEAEKAEGIPYNVLDIVALGLLSLGWRWTWLLNRAQSQKKDICSQLVDLVYHNSDLDLFTDNRPDGQVTPLDLLVYLAQGKQPKDLEVAT